MEKEDEYSGLVEPVEKQAFRLQIPFALRFAIIWTIFFSIVGIVIQAVQAPTFVFKDSIINFFGNTYIAWIKSFGSFVNITQYESGMQIFTSIMSQWYYFLYSGGLLALIWGIISWIINLEIVFRKRQRTPRPIIIRQNIIQEAPKSELKEKPQALIQPDIAEWLEEGLFLLSEGRNYEAESLYEQIKRYYDPQQDINQQTYKRILDFYYEIMGKKS